jgi:hypothetical protein
MGWDGTMTAAGSILKAYSANNGNYNQADKLHLVLSRVQKALLAQLNLSSHPARWST